MEEKVKKALSGVGFYGTLAVCLTIVGVCSWALLSEGEDAEETLLPVTPGDGTVQKAEMPEVLPTPAVETLETAEIPAETTEAPEPKTAEQPVMAEAPRLIVEPLRGEVLTAFSMEELVYSPTLGDWRTHNGIDIAAQAGTTVLAASAGTVMAVEEDALLGTTVVLEHEDGYETLYANLQAKPTVSAGETVSAGQIIGAVGATAAAEAGAPHLHFAVSKDGKAVDPREYLEK